MPRHRQICWLVVGLATLSLVTGFSAGPPTTAAGSQARAAAATVAAAIPVGRAASGIAIDATGVWVTSWFDDALWRIDPATNTARAVHHVPVSGSGGPEAIASGFGSLWVTTTEWDESDKSKPGSLLRVDPVTGNVAATIAVGRDSWEVVTGSGAVWVANADDGTLMRVDPATNKVTATIAIPRIWALAASADAIWATTEDGSLVRIDPSTNAVAATTKTGASQPVVAVGDAAVWVTSDDLGRTGSARLLRVDAAAATVVSSIDLPGHEVGDLAVAAGSIWVAMWDVATVVRVNAATNTVLENIPVSTKWILSLAATEREIWALGYLEDPFVDAPPPAGRVTRINYGGASEPTPSPAISTWRAKVGASGANGTATMTAAGSTGTLKLALKALTRSTAYPVKIVKGTCASPGSTLWAAPTQTSTSAGKIAKSLAIPAAKVAAIRAGATAGPIAIRIGSGSLLRCGPLTVVGPTATPTPTPTPASPTPTPAPTPTPSPSAGGTAYGGPYFWVALPEGWTTTAPPEGSGYGNMAFVGPEHQWLYVASWALDYTPAEALAAAIANLRRQTGADPEKTEDITMAGGAGKMLTYHFTDDGMRVHLLEVHCVGTGRGQGRVYEMIYTHGAGTEAADRALFLDVLKSFAFGPGF